MSFLNIDYSIQYIAQKNENIKFHFFSKPEIKPEHCEKIHRF